MPASYVAVHLLLTVVAAAAARQACRGRPRRAKWLVGGVVLLVLPLQALILARPSQLANLLGWPDLVFFSELWVLWAVVVVAAGLAGQSAAASTQRLRTGLLGLALVATAFGATRVPLRPQDPLAGRPTRTRGEGPQLVVLQTSSASCAPAAAATLLRARGLDPQASESQLARACLTDPERGTSDLGLFRGLARASGRPVRFAWPELAALRASAPCIAFVGLERGRVGDDALHAELAERCQWLEGQVHAVVLFGFEPADGEPRAALIGDPALGWERWPMRHFRALWTGRTLEVGR